MFLPWCPFLSRLTDEIDEIGRQLAQSIAPGSPVARTRRIAVRALLREAFNAVQDGRDDAALESIHNQLFKTWMELIGPGQSQLALRMSQRGEFGVVDQALVERSERFVAAGQRSAENIVKSISDRVERTLAGMCELDPTPHEIDPRPLKTRDEAREVVGS